MCRGLLRVAVLVLSAVALLPQAFAQEASARPTFPWKTGPTTGKLGGEAEVVVPAGYRFLGGKDAQDFLDALGNITSGNEWGVLTPNTADDLAWFIVFQFDDCGYVKDDEKQKLDADALLKSMKNGDEASNRERKKRHLPTMKTIGWDVPPSYDEKSHNLQWALRLESEGQPVINHNTRLLGRKGVMEAILVGDPDEMPAARKALRPLLSGFTYTSGNRYAEFRSGDKIAQYGLTALITGGAVAVALKSGLLAKAWKGLVAVAIAGAAVVKRIFRRSETA